MYSIGDPRDPQPDDPRFPSVEAAEIAAIEYCAAHQYDDPVVAVWQDDGGEVLALVFASTVYRP